MSSFDFVYDACTAHVETSPQEALAEARAARPADRPDAAHCEALALSALGRAAEAAMILERLAEDDERSESARAALHAQASAAWLIAARAERAAAAADAAIGFAPLNADHRLDRAAAAVALQDYARAEREAGAAIDIAPERVDVWVFRARVRVQLGDFEGAADDVRRALTLNRDDAEALALRGLLRANGVDLN